MPYLLRKTLTPSYYLVGVNFDYLVRCCEKDRQMVCERLTFNQMSGLSEKGRKERSRGVTGPSVDVEAYDGVLYYTFNFKSLENTTGMRHKGYIKFFKPKNPNLELGKVECMLDCTCPDFKYTYAWAVKQRGSTTVGSNSLNGCINRAPKIKNPRANPGLCKHLLALSKFIAHTVSSFPGTDPDTSEKIGKLVNRASKFILNGDARNIQRNSNAYIKNKAQAAAAGIPFQKKSTVTPVMTKVKARGEITQPLTGEVPINNQNPTNPQNESIFKNMENNIPLLISLVEEEEKAAEKQDGLSLLTDIKNTLIDIKNDMKAEQESEPKEEEEDKLEKDVEDAPNPPELNGDDSHKEVDSENPESTDKEV